MTVVINGTTGISGVDGSVGTPSYQGADTNTGMFFPAADTIAFGEGGAEAMRINSSGNVGIGTSSPGTKLEVSHSSLSYTDGLILTNSLNFGYGNSITFRAVLTDGGSVGNAARIQQSYESSNNYNLIFSTTGSGTLTERARITSAGYFKASNSGSYLSSAGSNHEFNQNGNNKNLVLNSSNGSLADYVNYINAHRAASTAYSFVGCFSGNDADLEFNLRGDGNGYADGTWNNNGADYAEFFESANGQALTLGATVVLDGTKVREATAQDDPKNIIGVVRPKEPSKASMVVGNTAWNKWANKYLTDDFDRYIMEDHDVVEWEEQVLEREAVAAVEAVLDEEGNEVSAAIPAQEAVYKIVQHSYESHNIPAGITVPADAVRKTHDENENKFQHYKLNPAWDKDAEYTPREKRPEWNIIGLLGQVKILKGQPVGDRWVKMRDVSSSVEEWMIR